MKHLLGIFIFIIVAASSAAAFDTIIETNEAFLNSQKLRGEAINAFQKGEPDKALDKFEEALSFRPNNPLLLGYVSYLAAETGNTSRARTAAHKYASLGLAPGKAIQAKLKEKLTPNEWLPLSKRFEKNIKAVGNTDIAFSVSADAKLVEAVAIKDEQTAYVSTVVSGNIYKISDVETNLFFNGETIGAASFFGLAYSAEKDSLYATFGVVDQSARNVSQPTSGVVEIDATTGLVKAVWKTATSEADPHQIADIIITRSGSVMLSDASSKKLYSIEGSSLKEVFKLPFAMSPQGIAEQANGKLVVADYGRGLWNVDLKNNNATLMNTPATINLVGLDGLVATQKDTFVAIQNGSNPKRVIEISLSHNQIHQVTVLAQSLPEFMEPTIGTTFKDSYFFVANSQWPIYGEKGELRKDQEQKITNILKLKH